MRQRSRRQRRGEADDRRRMTGSKLKAERERSKEDGVVGPVNQIQTGQLNQRKRQRQRMEHQLLIDCTSSVAHKGNVL